VNRKGGEGDYREGQEGKEGTGGRGKERERWEGISHCDYNLSAPR